MVGEITKAVSAVWYLRKSPYKTATLYCDVGEVSKFTKPQYTGIEF
jgi:hypothetical protein